MKEVVKLLSPINTTKLEGYAEGTDISLWMKAGVPGQLLPSFFIVMIFAVVSLLDGLQIYIYNTEILCVITCS